MNEFEQLGKRMSTDAVASLVAMHENSVYRHARELGGVNKLSQSTPFTIAHFFNLHGPTL